MIPLKTIDNSFPGPLRSGYQVRRFDQLTTTDLMKKLLSVNKCIAMLFSAAFLGTVSIASAATVYDNSITDLSIRLNPGTNEIGDEIVLAGTERTITSFSFQYWLENAGAGEDARIR